MCTSAGGATLSLLAPLHFDYKLSLFNGPDLMALPGVKQAVNWALGVSRCMHCTAPDKCNQQCGKQCTTRYSYWWRTVSTGYWG
jgi:hypothetical protein